MLPCLVALRGGAALPDKFDWRDQGVVPPIMDGGQSGSTVLSFLFSVDADYGAANKGLVLFSDVALFQCLACGLECQVEDVVDLVLRTQNGYMMKADDIPGPIHGCPFDPNKAVKVLNNASNYEDVADDVLKALIYEKGPVIFGVDASASSWQMYTGGIYCDPWWGSVDHVCVCVGWGVDAESGASYWILANEWGQSWGEGGYIRVCARGSSPYIVAFDAVAA